MNSQQEREAAQARHTAVLNSPEATGTPRANRDRAGATSFIRELNAHAALTIGDDWSRSGRELAKQHPLPWDFAAVRTGIAFERPARFDRLTNPHIVVAGLVIAAFLTVSDAGMVWQLVADVDAFEGGSR
jgi:hypothetical protein